MFCQTTNNEGVDRKALKRHLGMYPKILLILQAVDRGGHAASAVGEDGVGVAVRVHDGGVSQKSVYEA